MKVKNLTLQDNAYPSALREITDPPKKLFVAGDQFSTLFSRPRVTVIGSRKVSAYGKAVTAQLTQELARAGVVIISGLAIGIDSLAHQAALEAGTPTIAVLPSSIAEVYPHSHYRLAQQIVEQGGALVSEYPEGAPIYKTNFIARNRIASGLADAVLIIEAAQKSGTLHTARFALEQGKEVLAVPGNITSPNSEGTNNLIKAGATPVTTAEDVLRALGLEPAAAKVIATSSNPHEQILLELLQNGTSDGAELLARSQLEVSIFNQTLTMLEITGVICPLGNNHWALA
jgi:DNA processing protein